MWGAARRILIVDDNADTAQSLSWLLQSYGHEILVAHTGAAALNLAREFDPEAVLLDVGLPDIDGFEVARRLREDYPHALLVASTGHTRERDRVRAAEAGFDHYLVKPFDPGRIDQLLAAREVEAAVPV